MENQAECKYVQYLEMYFTNCNNDIFSCGESGGEKNTDCDPSLPDLRSNLIAEVGVAPMSSARRYSAT
jgi:hypothetical protein